MAAVRERDGQKGKGGKGIFMTPGKGGGPGQWGWQNRNSGAWPRFGSWQQMGQRPGQNGWCNGKGAQKGGKAMMAFGPDSWLQTLDSPPESMWQESSMQAPWAFSLEACCDQDLDNDAVGKHQDESATVPTQSDGPHHNHCCQPCGPNFAHYFRFLALAEEEGIPKVMTWRSG